MTVATRAVTFTPLVLDGVGSPSVNTGYYLIRPTTSYLDGVGRVAPLPLQVVVDGVAVAVDLPVTGVGWALNVVGSFVALTGETYTTTEYVTVPAGTGGLDFEDLPRVDPTTLTAEITPPDPAWWAAVTAATAWTPLYTGALTVAATTLASPTFAGRDELWIVVRVPSMSGADIPALRFNADSGTNYWSRYITAAASTTTLTNVPTASATMAKLSGISVAGSRNVDVVVANRSAGNKIATVVSATGSGVAATIPVVDISGAFEWINTTAQITAVTLLSAGGSQTMSAGTGMAIFGRDIQ